MKKVLGLDPYFEHYMGLLFARIVQSSKLKKINTVVELAPGFRIKGAYFLQMIHFTGTLYVLDTNAKVLTYLKEVYSLLLPEAKIVYLKKSLQEAIPYLPDTIDLLFSNHPLDDMIVGRYLGKLSPFAFNNTFLSQKYLYSAWKQIKRKQLSPVLSEDVRSEFQLFFKAKRVRLFILSQYRSAYYRGEENISDQLTHDLFQQLKKEGNSNDTLTRQAFAFDFPDFDVAKEEGFHLKDNIQNSKHWIVIKNEL